MTHIDESKLILNLLSNIKFGYTNTLGSEKVDGIINNLMVILNDSIQEIERLRANEKVLVDALEECNDVFSELDGVDWHEDSDFQYSSYSDTKEKIEQALAQVKK